MKIAGQFPMMALVIVGVLGAGGGVIGLARRQDSAVKDRMAIERLHRLDVETTLTDQADELAKL